MTPNDMPVTIVHSDNDPVLMPTEIIAQYKAAYFLVQQYKQRGLDAHRIRRRLTFLMRRSRESGMWTAQQHNWAAKLYVEAIRQQFGVTVRFDHSEE